MEVLEDGHRIVCLYQLIDGSVSSSFARHIAHLAGLPPEVLERAGEACVSLTPFLYLSIYNVNLRAFNNFAGFRSNKKQQISVSG